MKHWFECVKDKLDVIEENKRRFIFSLINNPLSVSESDVVKFIQNNLRQEFLMVLKYLSFSLNDKKNILGKSIHQFKIETYCFDKNQEKIIIDNSKVIYIEQQERIKEDLVKNKYKEWDRLSKEIKVNLYFFYMLSDLMVYMLLEFLHKNNDSTYKLCEDYVAPYKIMWFSRYFTQQSHFSDYLIQYQLNNHFNSRDSKLFQLFVDNALDKHLSFHPDYIKFLNKKDKIKFEGLRRKAEIVSYFSVRLGEYITGEHILNGNIQNVIKVSDLMLFGFSEREIEELFMDMSQLEIHEYDRIATKIDSENIKLNNINLKFALQTTLQNYLTNMNGRGIWFEKEYILEYLKYTLDDNRFVVVDGINDPKEKYDSDIIIYDKVTCLIYFCQIKHRVKTIHPFFKDEFHEYCHNQELEKGVKQLNALKDKILTVQVKDRLISRLGKKIINNLNMENSSRFVLLHTIENLDMCTKNGISMYEWNTFRNLLRGSVSIFKNNDFYHGNYDYNLIDFSDIVSVQDYLIKNLQRYYDESSSNYGPLVQWEGLKNSRISFFFNTSIKCMNRVIFKSKQKYWDIPLII